MRPSDFSPNFASNYEGPPDDAYTIIMSADGSGYLEYLGRAKPVQPAYTYTIGAATLTNIVVLSNVGTVTAPSHGLAVGNKVVLTGATVASDVDLNASYIIATVADGNTFTIATVSVADGTYTEATIVLTTTAPRSTAAIWSICRMFYTGTFQTRKAWANGVTNENQIWGNRASLTYA